MSKTLVFGHKNPDTDTICSAIALSYLKNELGEDTEPVRLGELNDETKFVLDYFGYEAPRLIGDVSLEADEVILVDHNERAQSADGIEQVTIQAVVDHHRIANFETNEPLYYRAEPVGCTATILVKLFRENGIAIPQKVAGLLVSAIISDTLLFKSPTSTEEDKVRAFELADIAGLDIEAYGLAELKAGAAIAGKTPAELINTDSKPFTIGAVNIEVAQINVVEFADVLALKTEILDTMKQAREAKQQDLFLLLVTDILNNNSLGLVSGNEAFVSTAFEAEVKDHIIDLPGVVSRKKQVIPVLSETIEKTNG
jgi:manganese-dependent inorganic pyrophosphatase